MQRSKESTAILAGVLFLAATTAFAADPAVKCESGKLKEAAKYLSCRLKAESKGVKKGLAPDYTKCQTKFGEKWTKIEEKAQLDPMFNACPSEGDQVSMDARITTDAAEVATLLAGGTVGDCGDGIVGAGEDCDFGDLAGGACNNLGFEGGTLTCGAGCAYDTSACYTCDSAGGVVVGGACWFEGLLGASCESTCSSAGLSYDEVTRTYAGSDGTDPNCILVLDALGVTNPGAVLGSGFTGIGCAYDPVGGVNRYRDSVSTTAAATVGFLARACACQ